MPDKQKFMFQLFALEQIRFSADLYPSFAPTGTRVPDAKRRMIQ